VVFISRSSQRDFERHFGRCEHATVIFNPVDAPAGRHAAHARIAEARQARRPGERYLIAAYHYYPHKNFGGILALFERMKRAGLVDCLDITGNGAAEVERMVAALAPEVRGFVRHRGLVSREELLRLYHGRHRVHLAVDLRGLQPLGGRGRHAGRAAAAVGHSGAPRAVRGLRLLRGQRLQRSLPAGQVPGAPRRTQPAWSLAAACAPAAMAGRYLMLKRGALSFARALP
jgi:hypothetical protein